MNNGDYTDTLIKDDKVENYSLIRHPIFIGNSVIVITTLQNENGMGLGDLFLTDYVDHRKELDRAATDLIEQIKDKCSIAFYWSLKEAIDRQIEERNQRNRESGIDKQFSFTRPNKE